MANRFIDTRFFKSPFVRSMKAPSKLLYTYIICECSAAGIWEKDLEAASLYTGVDQTEDEFRLFVETGRAIEISEGRIFFPDFILHQYPSGLQRNNPAHRNVISELLKLNLLSEDSEGALKPLQRSFKAPQVMVMVKEKVMGTEKDTVNAREKKSKPEAEKNQYPTYRDCMEVYSKFYEGQAGVVPKIDAADGKAMKTMIAYFRSAVKKKQPDLSEPGAEAAIVDSFRYIFANFDKWQPFHKGRLKLTQISSDLPNIIQSIKSHGTSNNSQQNRNGKGVHHVTPEEAAAALHRLHQEQSAGYGSDAAG